jgi:transposase
MEAEEKQQRVRRQFSAEFKAEAVRMVMSKERGQAAIARNLGIGLSTLHKWCHVARAQGNLDPAAATASEKSPEVKRLEAEIRRLKLEQEILKKATAFFAKDHA